MAVLFANNATSTLAAGITTGATTLAVQAADAALFPSPTGGDWSPVTVVEGANMEIMRCTARSGATLTVTRAQEGSTAKAFGAGALVDHRLTKAALDELGSPAQILAKLLTVDGAGSGLDADTLDGNNSSIFATVSSLGGYLQLIGGTLSGTLDIAPTGANAIFNISKQNGTTNLANRIAGRVGASVRWLLELGDITNETGGNVGSDFAIHRQSDAGGFIGTPFKISRATGVVTFAAIPLSTTPVTASNDQSVATTAFVKAQGYAPLLSPAFVGVPTAPTAAVSESSLVVATTAYVKGQGYITDAVSDGNQYARVNAGWSKVAPASLGTIYPYTFGTTTAAPPVSGSIRLNNSNQTLATTIWLHYTNGDAVDTKTYFQQRVKIGDHFYLQDKNDSTRWQLYELTAYVDSGAYATLTVIWRSGGSALLAQAIVVSREGASVSSPIGEAPNDGKQYGRQSLAWTAIPKITVSATAPSSPAVNDVWIDTT